MKRIFFVLTLVLALSVCAFADTIIYEEDFSTSLGDWKSVLWDEANERAINNNAYGPYYVWPAGTVVAPNENWVISYDLTVANAVTNFDPDRALPMFYHVVNGDEMYFLFFTNTNITTTTINPDYKMYSYTVDAGENRSGLAAGINSCTDDIDELLNQRYRNFSLIWKVNDMFGSDYLHNSTGNIYLDNVKIIDKSPNVVPEPMTVASVAMGLASLVGMRRFKK